WLKPSYDGGSIISDYIIEKKLKDEEWSLGGTSRQCEFEVKKLKEHSEVFFRVAARNEKGQGEFVAIGPIKVIDYIITPEANLSEYPDGTLSIRLGHNVHIELPYKGKPKPSMLWLKDNLPLKESEQIRFKKTENKATLMIKNVRKENEGKYTLTLDNKVNRRSFHIHVITLGPPSKPVGPIRLDEVRADSIMISWDEPNDDGGGDITCYTVEKRDTSQSNWKMACSHVQDTQFKVLNLIKGVQYQFKVYAENRYGVSEPLISQMVIAKHQFRPPGPPGKPVVYNVTSDGMTIQWEKPIYDGGTPIQGFHVEKKEMNSIMWQKVNTMLIKETEYRILGLIEGLEYSFRVYAQNDAGFSRIGDESKPTMAVSPVASPNIEFGPEYFEGLTVKAGDNIRLKRRQTVLDSRRRTSLFKSKNESGLSSPQETVVPVLVKEPHIEPTADLSEIDGQLIMSRSGSTFTIDVPISGRPAPKITWKLEEMRLKNTDRVSIKEAQNRTSISVKEAMRGDSGKYNLILENAAGTKTFVVDVNVIGKPSPPTGPIEISSITAESCILNWHPPEDDGGTDITNYIVEKRESGSTAWQLINSSVKRTSLFVSHLTKYMQYTFRVSAENNFGVSKATESETIVAEHPFTPPGPPTRPSVFNITANTMTLKWEEPYHDGGSKVTGYWIEKKERNNILWVRENKIPCFECNYRAESLVEGLEYQFRVYAMNSAGLSKASEASKGAVAQNPVDPPTKPEVTNVTRTTVSLKWSAPLNDGGSPIVGYIIERKPYTLTGEGRWLKCNYTNVTDTFYTVTALGEGEPYEFRVIAKNANQVCSIPSESTGSVQCKTDFEPPKAQLDSKLMSETVMVRAGSDLVLDAAVGGRPEPKAFWSKGNRELDLCEKYHLQYSPTRAMAVIKFCDRDDTGKYILTVKNVSGTKTAEVSVKVLDTPGVCEGSITISKVTEESCTLSWKPPVEDGGDDVSHYIVERRDTNRLNWVIVHAECKELNCNITRLFKNTEYLFRVRGVNKYGPGVYLQSEPMVARNTFTVPSPPGSPEIVASGKDFATIEWMKPESDGGSPLIHYLVERREKKSARWVKINRDGGAEVIGYILEMQEAGTEEWKKAHEKTLRGTEYVVIGLSAATKYYFRVAGVNINGTGEFSEPCAAAEPVERIETPDVELADDLKKTICLRAGGSLRLSVKVTGRPVPAITWSKSETDLHNRGFIEVTNTSTTLIIDKVHRYDAGKYTVVAENSAGKQEANILVKVYDTPGPTRPIKIKELTKESVTISWEAPAIDGGAPVNNYIIERREASMRAYKTVTSKCSKTTFKIDGLMEGMLYYFRVLPENIYGIGEPRETPDAILVCEVPLSPHKLEVIDVTKTTVTLGWEKPEHDGGSRLTGYIIEACKFGTDRWMKVATLKTTDFEHTIEKLNESEQYLFRIRAINSRGASEPKELVTAVTVQEQRVMPEVDFSAIPQKVINVLAGKTLELDLPIVGRPPPVCSWYFRENRIKITDRIHFKSTGKFSKLVIHDTNIDDTGDYTLEVTNAVGLISEVIKVIILSKPDEPKGPLRFDEIDATTVTCSWDPPIRDGGAPISGFVVEQRDAHRPGWVTVCESVSRPTFKFENLIEGDEYVFRAAATNRYGTGEFLQSEIVTCKSLTNVPGPPGRPTVFDISRDGMTVAWNPPEEDGGLEVSGYIIERKEVRSDRWVRANKNPITMTRYRSTELIEGLEYEHRVTALNAKGLSKPSLPSKPAVATDPIDPPGCPQNPRITDTTKTSVSLAWSPPDDEGDARVDGYLIEMQKVGTTAWIKCNTTPSLICEYTLTNMPQGEEFKFRVMACNAGGSGEPAEVPGTVTVTEMLESPDFDLEPKYKDLYTVRQGGVVRLSVPIRGKPQPTCKWSKDFGALSTNAMIVSTEDVSELVIKGAERSDSGLYDLLLENRVGKKKAQIKVKVIGRPSAPEGPLVFDDIHANSVKVSWKVPIDNGGSEILGYILERREATRNAWYTVESRITETQVVVKGLKEGTEYHFKVTAENSFGFSSSLKSEHPVVPKTPLCSPEPPSTPPEIMDITKNSVALAWSRPKDDGGSAVTGYFVEYRIVSSDTWSRHETQITSTMFTLSGLTPDSEYQFRIFAVNSIGESEAGPVSDSVTCKDPFDKPSQPGEIDIVQVTNNSVAIRWQAPECDGGKEVLGYWVECRKSIESTWKKCNKQRLKEKDFTVAGLAEATEYEFRVLAENETGISRPRRTATCIKTKLSVECQPSLRKEMDEVTTKLGQPAIMKCQIIGRPVPDIKWYHAGKEIVESRKYQMSSDGRNHSLSIITDQQEDEGEYTCKAINDAGEAETSGILMLEAAPSFHPDYPLKDTYCTGLGTTLRIHVVYIGRPQPKIMWLHGAKTLENTEDITIETTEHYTHLIIKNVQRRVHGGKYRIRLHNHFGRADTAFNVEIYDKPDRPRGPIILDALLKNSVIISWKPPTDDGGCMITNYIVEKHEDKEGGEWELVSSSINGTSCRVPNLTDSAGYFFRVYAQNRYGNSEPLELTSPILIKSQLEKPSPPLCPIVSGITKDSCVVSWKPPISDGGSKIKSYCLEMKYKDKREWSEWTPVTTDEIKQTVFSVKCLTEGVEYVFRVKCENLGGQSDYSEETLSIHPAAAIEIRAPAFKEELRNMSVKYKSNAALVCKITGQPKPVVKWLRRGKEIHSDGKKIKIQEFKGGYHQLVISEVDEEDSTVYQIRATNQGGSICATISLDVEVPAKIHLPKNLKDKEAIPALRGEVVNIKIPFVGKPDPVITWQKGQDLIDSNGHYQVIVTRSFTSLVFPSGVEKKDAGFYIVCAKNRFGIDQQTVELDVADVPDPPRGVKASDISRDSVTLNWVAPANDGGSRVISYIIEKCPTTAERWQRVAQSRDTHYTVINLFGGTSYQFRVIAENKFGQSAPSETSGPVMTKEDKSRVLLYDREVDDTGHVPRGKAQHSDSKNLHNKYAIAEELNRGHFGIVHRCIDICSEKTYMAKFVKVRGADQAFVKKEITILNLAKHANFLLLHESFESPEDLVMIYDFISGVDIFERLSTADFELTEREIVNYIRQICSALAYGYEDESFKQVSVESLDFTDRLITKERKHRMTAAEALEHPWLTRPTEETSTSAIPTSRHKRYYQIMAKKEWNTVVSAARVANGGSIRSQRGVLVAKVKIAPYENGPVGGLIRHAVVKEGDSVKFVCNIENYDSTTEVTWYCGVRQLEASDKYEIAYEDGVAVITINKITRADDGTYRCKIVNEYGEDSAYAELFVTGVRLYRDYFTSRVVKKTKRRVDTARMLQKPPEFTLPLVNRTAYIGEDLRFGVTITVHPDPRVTWHKSGQKLIPGLDDKKYTFISDKGLYQLIIHNLDAEDDAEYSVVARNRYGEDSCKARLTVVPRPKPADLTLRPMFKRLLANLECKEGQDVRFEIRVSGHPTLRWEKDGAPLAFGPSIEVVHEGLDYFILHVRDVLPEDSGVYRVTATNSAGSASCQATLKVERVTHVKKEIEISKKETKREAGQEQLDKKVRLSQILTDSVVAPLPPLALRMPYAVPTPRVINPAVLEEDVEIKHFKPLSDLKWYKKLRDQYEFPEPMEKIVQKRMKRVRLSRWEQFYEIPVRIKEQYKPKWRISSMTQDDLEIVRPAKRRTISPEIDTYHRIRRRSLGDLSDEELLLPVEEYLSMKRTEEERLRLEEEIELGFSASPPSFSPVHFEPFAPRSSSPRRMVVDDDKEREDIHTYDSYKIPSKYEAGPTFVDLRQRHDKVTYKAPREKQRVYEEREDLELLRPPTTAQRISSYKSQLKRMEVEEKAQTLKRETGARVVVSESIESEYLTAFTSEYIPKPIKKLQMPEPTKSSLSLAKAAKTEVTLPKIDFASRYAERKQALRTERKSAEKKFESMTQPPFSLDLTPRITVRMRSHRVSYGSSTSFTLNVQAKPEPEITWFHNGKELHQSSKYHMSNISGVLTLQINNCVADDSGAYRVICKNAKGETSDYATLDVAGTEYAAFSSLRKDEEPPYSYLPEMTRTEVYHVSSKQSVRESVSVKESTTLVESSTAVEKLPERPGVPAKIVNKPHSLTVNMGDLVRFSCDVDGDPAPSITWIHDGAVITSSAHHHIFSTQYDSHLEISSVTMADEGSYMVLVENAAGKQEAHFTLTIFKAESTEQVVTPTRVMSPETETPFSKSPDPVRSPQRVRSPDPKSPQRVKSPVSGKTTPKLPGLKSPPPSDKAPITSSVKSPKRVMSPDPEKKSSISVGPNKEITSSHSQLTIAEGQSLTLSARIPGASSIRWLLNGKELSNSDQYRYGVSGANQNLTIMSVSHHHQGKITCEAETAEGLVRCQFDTTVTTSHSAAPHFLSQPRSQNVVEGQNVKFTCEVSGEPFPDIEWLKDNMPINVSSNIKLSCSQNVLDLEIWNVTAADSGKYTVKAKNEFGQCSATSSLHVHTLTQEPMEMMMVLQTETISTAGSIQKSFSGPEVHGKAFPMHADSSSPSAAAKFLIDKRSESSMSAMMSESMVSMTSSSQMKKMSVFSHAEASSSLQTLSSELKMGSPPKIKSLSQNMGVEEGQTLTLSGAFSGDPAPLVQWIHSGQRIPTEEKRYRVENSTDISTLRISAVKEGDAGAYTLMLTNEFGSDTATVNVHIRSI
ncbi:unnamed protein product, partial [Tetraodon nigroviridis]